MKRIIVLTKNKLNATDTICPLLLDLKKSKSNIKITFYIPRLNTLFELKKNIILYDALSEISEIKYIHNKSKFFNKLRSILLLINLTFNAFIGSKFIHFGIFDYFPYKFLLFINSKNFYHMQNETYDSSMGKNLAEVRQMGLYHLFNINDPMTKNIAKSKNIIVNNVNSFYFKHPNSQYKNYFVYGPSRNREVWLKYISNKQNYYDKLTVNKNNKIIFYPLATFEPIIDLKNNNSFFELFNETIDTLNKISNVTVIIKPHIYTNIEIVQKKLKQIKNKNFIISYLHPSLLINNSDLCICNLYTTIFAEAFLKNLYTLEYSDYSDADLEYTNNNSKVPEYTDFFLNKSSYSKPATILLNLVEKILSLDKKNNLKIDGADRNGLINALTIN